MIVVAAKRVSSDDTQQAPGWYGRGADCMARRSITAITAPAIHTPDRLSTDLTPRTGLWPIYPPVADSS